MMNISLFTFKKDADLNQDNNLSAAELTIWFKNNVVKAGVKGLKTYTQLEEMRYNQDKGKSTTQRAMSGAAFGFRLR